jgi:UDP:flavonoid glycosyltransferase YjiC (YdhE family)
MRVLFTGAPAVGHLFPMIPLAWALRGHDVLFASYNGAEPITRAGMPLVNIAPELDASHELLAVAGARRPDLLKRVTDSATADRDAFVRLYAHVNDRVADSLVAHGQEWRPDLIVFEPLATAGVVAAAALGVPAVQHNLGFGRNAALRATMLEELADSFARHGVAAPPADEVQVIDIAPPSTVAATDGWPLRPVSFSGGGTLPQWLRHHPDRPRVAVTLGTFLPHLLEAAHIRPVFEAMSKVDAEFVFAQGNTDLAQLGELPENVRAVGGSAWLPWNALLRTCTASVHHGGSGSSLASMEAGLPQLVLPSVSESGTNADAVADRGVGLRSSYQEMSVDLLEHILYDGAMRAAAAEVRDEIAAMTTPAELVPRLAVLAGLAGVV